MKKTIEIMTTAEAFFSIYNDEQLRKEYHEDFQVIDIEKATENENTMQIFLDNEAVDIERLSMSLCEFLGLEYFDGYYISTWNDEYLSDSEWQVDSKLHK